MRSLILVGCDKTIPGGIMALARLDIPGLILYGGSIAPGKFEGHSVTIQDVYEAVGTYGRGEMTRRALERAGRRSVSRSRRMRRPIHRQHHGAGCGISWRSAHGTFQYAGNQRGEG